MDSPRYEVGFPSERVEAAFAKDLRKLSSKQRLQISKALEGLAESQRAQGKSFKSLRGSIVLFGCLAQYRLRAGDYRIFYDVDDARRKAILLAIRRRHEHTCD